MAVSPPVATATGCDGHQRKPCDHRSRHLSLLRCGLLGFQHPMTFLPSMRELRSLLPYLQRYRELFPCRPGARRHLQLLRRSGPEVPAARHRCAGDGGAFRRGADCGRAPAAGGAWRAGLRATACANCSTAAAAALRPTCETNSINHLQRMSAEFYDRYPTGDVMARTTNDLLAVRMVAGPALMYLVDTTVRALLIAPGDARHQPPADAAGPGAAAGVAGGDGVAGADHSPPVARRFRSSSAS